MTRTDPLWPSSAGEMAARIRAFEWSKTSLGPIDVWPTSLRLTLTTILEHPLPMVLCWGPDLIMIYNNAYVPLLRGKPHGLGRPFLDVWEEVRDTVAPQIARAFAGEAIRLEDAPFMLERGEGPKEAFFNYTFSPVRDEYGTIVGVLNTGFETTGYVLAERRRTAMENALRASEERFRALVTTGTYTIYRMSHDWRQMHQLDGCNFLADTGETSEDWANQYILSEDRAVVSEAIEVAIQSKRMFELEHRVRRADGDVGWTLSRAVPILTDDGEIIEWFGAASDITARRASEAALRESEARFREFGENSSDALWILDAETKRLEYLSPAYERIWGEGREPVMADLSRWVELAHPDDRDAASQALPRLLAGEAYVADYRIIRPDGEVRWIRDTGFPIKEGTVVKRGGGIAQDVTDLKQTEVALHEIETRQRALIEGVPQLVWRAADDGEWTWASPQWTAYTGQNEPESRGWGWLDPIHPDDRDVARAAWKCATKMGAFDVEYRICHAPEKRYRWFQTRATPVRDKDGAVVEWLGTSTDVDDLRALQRRLEVLVNELQHRARNLLGVVTAIADRTVKQGGAIEAFEERLQALSRAQGLLSQGGSDTVEVGAMVRAELAAHADSGSERTSVSGPEVHLQARQVQNFALALHELATNAVKYGALKVETGRLAITWEVVFDRREHRRLALSWIESGVAIELDQVTRRGYGTELIQEALAYALEADVDYELGRNGVRCRIEMPIT